MRRRLGWLCFIGAISVGGMAISQTVHRTIHQPTSAYSQLPFSGTLGPHYMGNDLRQIYDTLASRLGTNQDGFGNQGEFETTLEYQARIRRAVDTPIANGIKLGSQVAFVIPSPLHNNLEYFDIFLTTRYNADQGTMLVQFYPSLTYQLGEPNDIYSLNDRPNDLHSIALLWGGSNPSFKSWTASNAFGASVEVKDEKYDAYGLAFDLSQPLETQKLLELIGEGADASFLVPADEARIIKDRLRVLVVCELKDDPLMAATDYHKATITDPNETTARYKYLHVAPIGLWIFDEATGKVYLKRSAIFFDDSEMQSQ